MAQPTPLSFSEAKLLLAAVGPTDGLDASEEALAEVALAFAQSEGTIQPGSPTQLDSDKY